MTSGDAKLAANDRLKLSFVEDVQASEVRQHEAESSTADPDVAGTILGEPNVRRSIGLLTMIALCFNICSSWAGLSTSIQIALSQGGPVTLIYGTILITAIYLCISLLIAELGSVYPTAGGQYHFTSILAPKRMTRSLSYACGFITIFQWVSSGAAVMVITATQIMALVGYFNPGAQGEAWHLFLIYQAIGVLALFYNLLILNRLPVTHTIGFILSIAIFLATFIGILGRASPKATHEFVWTTFINKTGWPNGVCFLTGLITPAFMYGGLDGALHLSEEAKNPRKIVPRACVGVIIVGFCTAFPFAIALLYSISDFQTITESSGFVPFEINAQGLRSADAAAALLCAGCVLGFFILNALLQSSSRLVWSFARDDGFAFSHIIRRIHPVLNVPVWATFLNWLLLALCGFLILASSIGDVQKNYTPVVLALIGILGLINWVVYARKHFKGPRILLEDQPVSGLEVRVE
ncbi:hypothetical protein LTR84_011371 [Exophiala bonariae]|uniref:Amino acid permease/ SLC12A domain-containing protein n=1 Tax=Exophiala bonariae TaxID=1690606 RepID=A0AAV9MTN9_9EURO|nr:hypothetical protein LTR84_011371 [Exophiala bonariae]